MAMHSPGNKNRIGNFAFSAAPCRAPSRFSLPIKSFPSVQSMSLQPFASDTSASVCIYASTLLYGRSRVMLALLADLEKYLQPCLTVVHVSRGSESLNRSMLPNPSRQLLNSERRHVERAGPTIFAAHLRNLALLAKAARPAERDKVVLLAGNQRFFRDCRNHILRTELSFMLGELADLRCPDCAHGTKRPIQFPSGEFEAHRRGVLAENDR